jgi:hypothetical protein
MSAPAATDTPRVTTSSAPRCPPACAFPTTATTHDDHPAQDEVPTQEKPGQPGTQHGEAVSAGRRPDRRCPWTDDRAGTVRRPTTGPALSVDRRPGRQCPSTDDRAGIVSAGGRGWPMPGGAGRVVVGPLPQFGIRRRRDRLDPGPAGKHRAGRDTAASSSSNERCGQQAQDRGGESDRTEDAEIRPTFTDESARRPEMLVHRVHREMSCRGLSATPKRRNALPRSRRLIGSRCEPHWWEPSSDTPFIVFRRSGR